MTTTTTHTHTHTHTAPSANKRYELEHIPGVGFALKMNRVRGKLAQCALCTSFLTGFYFTVTAGFCLHKKTVQHKNYILLRAKLPCPQKGDIVPKWFIYTTKSILLLHTRGLISDNFFPLGHPDIDIHSLMYYAV